jgi:hypothetical protein
LLAVVEPQSLPSHQQEPLTEPLRRLPLLPLLLPLLPPAHRLLQASFAPPQRSLHLCYQPFVDLVEAACLTLPLAVPIRPHQAPATHHPC